MKKIIGSGLIMLGILLVFSGMLFFFHPYYTFAAPEDGEGCRASVSPTDTLFELGNLNPGDTVEKSLTITNEGDRPISFTIKSEWVDGDPEPGEGGDLYNHLLMIVSYEGDELYNGLISGLDKELEDTLNLGDRVGDLAVGDSVQLNFVVHLFGPETGNEFQGSTLTTRIIVAISCDDDDEEEIIVYPEDPGVEPELPKTGGFNYIYLTVLGLFLILTGLVLSNKVVE